ncbi:glycosyltransferase [Mucilaginibacter lappiensis]|uniref:MGT family glycosyltransferase n=1 Tax=Mucilaginibacter lappiensis TaxID=354630 RepID=A0A841JC25_9SPHI|nr:MGT family glycosyltransferase [Mucilaginibacter lappiensis]
MSNVLFLGMPSHGHVNPTLGLVSELVKQGEKVVYFAAEPFREKIEATGAQFKAYKGDLDIFTPKNGQTAGKPGGLFTVMQQVIAEAPEIISDILMQTKDIKFDYLIHSAAFLFTKPMVQILNIPAVSSLAVFAGLRHFSTTRFNQFPGAEVMMAAYLQIAVQLEETYKIKMPRDMMELLMNKSELNLVYTSKFFVPDPDFFDDNYKFVGPPIFPRKENLDFPFEKLEGKRVLYISLGTVFGNFNPLLYDIFF